MHWYACMCECIDVDEATRQLARDTIVVASCDERLGLLAGCCMWIGGCRFVS